MDDENFFFRHFEQLDADSSSLHVDETQLIERLKRKVEIEFSSKKYFLGLILDFCLLAQELGKHDPKVLKFALESGSEFFERTPPLTHKGGKELNTLTIALGGYKYGIRKHEEGVKEFFEGRGFTNYPSAYVYNTGQWKKFETDLFDVFSLSSSGRKVLVTWCIDFGERNLTKLSIVGLKRPPQNFIFNLFQNYPFSAKDENGGLFFQSLIYAWCVCVFNNEKTVSAGVRTGSSRQKRIGDIDVYSGDELATSVEVKDLPITETNFEKQLGQFSMQIRESGIHGIVACRSVTPEIEKQTRHLHYLTDGAIVHQTNYWHVKQWIYFSEQIRFYLKHIEMNQSAHRRFTNYLSSNSDFFS